MRTKKSSDDWEIVALFLFYKKLSLPKRMLTGADPGICVMGAGPSPSLSLPFASLFSLFYPPPPPRNRPLKTSSSPGRKRIWCTLKLSESHASDRVMRNGGSHSEYSEYHVLHAWRDKLADGVAIIRYVVTYQEYLYSELQRQSVTWLAPPRRFPF